MKIFLGQHQAYLVADVGQYLMPKVVAKQQVIVVVGVIVVAKEL